MVISIGKGEGVFKDVRVFFVLFGFVFFVEDRSRITFK